MNPRAGHRMMAACDAAVHLPPEPPTGLDPDEIGLDGPNLGDAYSEAYKTVPGLAADLARNGLDPAAYGSVVADAEDRPRLDVPFTERMRSWRLPERPKRQPSPRGASGEAARSRHRVREIQSQIAALAAAAEAARAALHRSRALVRNEAPGDRPGRIRSARSQFRPVPV